ncbi:MAG: hypothetical protein NW218_09390 [Saprospiraceae bacterium]|nr:hypothetical protein [Saprospiraceae bacterium]
MNTELILQNVEKHIHLDAAEAEFFVSLLQEKRIKRKDYLLRQGEVYFT